MADDPREFAYVGDHAVNIESGALLGPGDRVSEEDLGKGDKYLIDDGMLIEYHEPTAAERKAAEHEQLVAQAKALDIRGRTNMSDSELRKAIDERQNEEG